MTLIYKGEIIRDVNNRAWMTELFGSKTQRKEHEEVELLQKYLRLKMRLRTEELQYVEISLSKDYNERLTVKRNEAINKRGFEKLYKSANS